MKFKFTRTLIALAVTAVLSAWLLPLAASAEKSITFGTAALKPGSSVYYGTYNNAPILWRILTTDGSDGGICYDENDVYELTDSDYDDFLGIDGAKQTSSQTGTEYVYRSPEDECYKTKPAMLLLADRPIREMAYTGTSINLGQIYWSDWRYSGAWKWCNDTTDSGSFISSSFSDSERELMLKTCKESKSSFGTDALRGDTFFFLSEEEVQSDYAKDYRSIGTWWYLRTPSSNREVCAIDPNGGLSYSADVSYASAVEARPAFNLMHSVLFTSTESKQIAVGTMQNVDECKTASEAQAAPYKLTMCDDSSFGILQPGSPRTAGRGQTFEFRYHCRKDHGYISALILGENDEVLYYGQLKEQDVGKTGWIKCNFPVPSDIADGTYTVYLFFEQINEGLAPDFASNYAQIELTVGLVGSGTSEEPYLLYNLQDLETFRDKVNAGETDLCAKLMDDIVANPGTFASDGSYTSADGEAPSEWDSIGATILEAYSPGNTQKTVTYTGIFDGNGKTISGLYYDGENDYVGLFGCVGGSATVKNLTVKNSYFKGNKYVGAVVGYAKPEQIAEESDSEYVENAITAIVSIIDCCSDATVCGSEYVGGIVGYADVTGQTMTTQIDRQAFKLQNCSGSGKVACTGNNVGGLIGGVKVSDGVTAVIDRCSNAGNVSGSNNVGGIAGDANVAAITTDVTKKASGGSSSGTITIPGTTVTYSDNSSLTVSNCYNTGTVDGAGSVGGIVGNAYLKYSPSSSTTSGALAAGRVPTDGVQELTVSRCFNIGTINGTEKAGGITGYAVYATGSIIVTETPLTTVTDCYYLIETADAGMGYGTDQTISKDNEAFASGEVAYLLQGNNTESAWGQSIGTDEHPTFDGARVYEDEYNGIKAYRNEIDGSKILRLSTDKEYATVVLDTAGSYTLYWGQYTDFDSNPATGLEDLKAFAVTVTEPQAIKLSIAVYKESEDGFVAVVPNTGDKLILLDSTSLAPQCEAYIVN